MMSAHWKDNATTGVALGAAVAFAVYVGLQYWKQYEPASNWLEIESIGIRDAELGEDPRMVFRRNILRDFPATFIASVFRFPSKTDSVGTFYCSGQGGSNYKTGRKLPPSALTLSWIMNRENNPCKFERGIYRLTVSYTIMPDGYPPKGLTVDSNYFVVPPEAEQIP